MFSSLYYHSSFSHTRIKATLFSVFSFYLHCFRNTILFSGIGELLLIASLTCDGLTGAVQERMKSEYQTKSGHMMQAMNKWSILYLGVALTFTGEIWEFIAFVQRHPSVMGELAVFSVASALGQVCKKTLKLYFCIYSRKHIDFSYFSTLYSCV